MTPWGFADESARDPQAEAPPPSAGPDDGAVCIFKKDGRAESQKSAVAEVHQPSQAENGGHEATEDIEAVVQALTVGPFAHDSEDNRGKQREQKRGFEMGWIPVHQDLLPTAIS
jgi:hypothetical protein